MSACPGASDEIGSGFRPPRRWHRVERRRLRRAADRRLLSGAAPDSHALLAWRASELTSDRNRHVLANSLRGIVDELDPHLLPGSSPLNRAAARPHADLIDELAERLEDVDRPVSARGVLLTSSLLTDGASPLYARDRAGEIRGALARCLSELDEASAGRGSGVRRHAADARAGRVGDGAKR